MKGGTTKGGNDFFLKAATKQTLKGGEIRRLTALPGAFSNVC